MRDKRIDILRFLGLSLIVLAHVSPPWWLFELRNFDVPLIVMLSGAAFRQSSDHTMGLEDYPGYVWKRFKRLVAPVWLFLTGYFVVVWLLDPHAEQLTLRWVAGSYFLTGGIGYVWILRVFLMVALLTPLQVYLHKTIKDNWQYILMLVALMVLYQLSVVLLPFLQSHFTDLLFPRFFHYGFGYFIIFALGARLQDLERRQTVALAMYCLIVFVALGISHYFPSGEWASTQDYKNPPSAYYLSYAVFCSMVAWLAVKPLCAPLEASPVLDRCITFVSQNSIWIYLWHIAALAVFSRAAGGPFLMHYVMVYGAAIAVTAAQVTITHRLILPLIRDDGLRKNVQTALTG